MPIEHSRVGDILVVRISGRMEVPDLPEIGNALAGLLAYRAEKAVIDLSGVSYISSQGVGLLARECRAQRAKGGDVRLCSLPDVVRQVVDLTGVSKQIQIFPDLQTAIDSYATEPPSGSG